MLNHNTEKVSIGVSPLEMFLKCTTATRMFHRVIVPIHTELLTAEHITESLYLYTRNYSQLSISQSHCTYTHGTTHS